MHVSHDVQMAVFTLLLFSYASYLFFVTQFYFVNITDCFFGSKIQPFLNVRCSCLFLTGRRKVKRNTPEFLNNNKPNLMLVPRGMLVALRIISYVQVWFTSLISRNQSSDILQHTQNRPTRDRWVKL